MSWIDVGVAAVTFVASAKNSSDAAAQQNQNAIAGDSNASQSIANMQAVEAQASAQEEAQRAQSDQYLGRQRAAMGDSGTGSLGSGSNLDVARQSAVSAEMDALNVRYAGQLKGEDALQSAYNFKYGANVSTANAGSIASSAFFNAGTAALTSGANSYSRGVRTNTGTPGMGTNTYGSTSGSLS